MTPRRTRGAGRYARALITVIAVAGLTLGVGLTTAGADVVPYSVPVQLQSDLTSPPVDAAAPYTPAVLSLISQLEAPGPTLTLAQIQNASTLLHDGTNNTCNAVGPVGGPVGVDAAGNPIGTTLVGNATTLVSQTDATHITVASGTGLTTAGTTIYVGSGASAESATVASGSGTALVLNAPGLTTTHAAGEPVVNNAALSGAGAKFPVIKVASVTGFAAGQQIWINVTSSAEQATIASVGTAGVTGTGITLTSGLTKVHQSGRPVYITTTPSVTKECWADAQGINPTGGPSGPGGGAPNGQTLTTSPNEILGDASTFDRHLLNVWGQTEAVEGRELMMTGLFGPQTDLNRLPNWGRGHQTGGEDPYLSGQLVAAQIHGIQGKGFMSEMKHFLMYNGQNQNAESDVQDQAAHELYASTYEAGFVLGRAAATMCSYQIWKDTSTNSLLASPISTLTQTSPYAQAGQNPQTWPLNESHFACEQPLSLTYWLRDLWGSAAMVGTDYPAQHSTSGVFQGMEQEMPTTNGFNAGGTGSNDPTGSTCAYTTAATSHTPGDEAPCTGATDPVSHIGGIPNHYQGSAGTGCAAPTSTTGSGGCTLNQAVLVGVVPLSVYNQALARALYQQQRFGMLGCDPYPTATCANPGGIGSDRSGNALIPVGPSSGASPTTNLGTENGDAGVAELTSEEGSVLFKNANRSDGSPELPIKSSDLTSGNIALIGPAAEYAVASPSREASQGFPDRIAINPLTTLRTLGASNAFVNVPAISPTGFAVPTTALKTPTDTAGLSRTTGTGSPATDSQVDFEAVNGNQLTSASTLYTWTGCIFVPTTDGYTFRFQNTPGSAVAFGLSNDAVGAAVATTLSAAANPGDVNIKVASVSNMAPGQSITIDSGANAETRTIATVGTAGATGTGVTLTSALSNAHASGAPVASAGPSVTTLAAASAAGATNIKVTSVAGFAVGQTVVIDTGANQESRVITAVGTAGATGTGLTLATALTNAHATGSMVALGGPGSAGEGTSTTSCSNAWSTLGGTGAPLTRTLSTASTFYQGHYQGNVPVATTNAGYVDQGMQNRQFPSGVVGQAAASTPLGGGEYYAIRITDTTPATAPDSLRFAYSRVNGDNTDAAAAATGKGMAVVFVNDEAVPDGSGPTSIVAGIGQYQINLINAVAAANPNTVVILQSAYADTVSTWLPNVKALMETWNSGQEGAVATARLLLGQANPSGHTAMTWPAGPQDSIWGYNQTSPLYPGDTTGTHGERLNGGPNGTTQETEGIYTGYRYFDKEGITPLFPFGFGLSYTTFQFSKESVTPSDDGGLDVSVRVKNTGQMKGDEVVQVYLGAPSSPPANVQFAVRSLSQFQRVTLAPGETEAVKTHIPARQLNYWSEAAQRWVRATGDRTVWVGDADALDHLPQSVTVTIPQTTSTTCSNQAINATSIQGDIDVPAGSWCDLVAVTLSGKLTLHSPTGVRIRNSTINGGVLSNASSNAANLASYGQNVICNSTISNGLQISNSSAASPWNIGGVCGGNTIAGGLTFNSNAGTSSITGNTISGGDLKCQGNGPLTGSGNTVTGGTKRGQCSGF